MFMHICLPLSYKIKRKKVKSLSRVWLCVTPWAVAYQAPLSMGFSRQEYWSGLPGIVPTQVSNLGLPHCRQTLYHLSDQGSQSKRMLFSFNNESINNVKHHIICGISELLRILDTIKKSYLLISPANLIRKLISVGKLFCSGWQIQVFQNSNFFLKGKHFVFDCNSVSYLPFQWQAHFLYF